MEFTEHEMTLALTGAAKTVLAARRKDIRKGKVGIDEAWEAMERYQRFTLLNALGDQVLPVLVALPEVEVPTGTRPSFDDAQILHAVEQHVGETGGRMRRKVVVAARVGLVKNALSHLPVRSDPDTLDVPDHL